MSHVFKLLFFLSIILTSLISNRVDAQSNISYKKLTNLLPLVKNDKSNIFYCYDINEESLNKEVLKLNWDLSNSETFEKLFEELNNISIDYKYYLLISKICSSIYREFHMDRDNSYNLIDYYYKSRFLYLAIENGINLNWKHKDSLKYEYTKQYSLSTINENCFPDFDSFKEFADINITYCNEILTNPRFNLTKKERSELYWIIADAIYRTKYIEEKNEQSLSEVFRYLSLAINEDAKNWRAIRDRADYNKNHYFNYKTAVKDYLLWLKIIESENKVQINGQNKSLFKNKISSNNVKGYMITHPTFTTMADIAECYLNLNDYNNVLLWCDRGITSIKEYREFNIYSDELSSRYEGLIYYLKAVAHYNLMNKKLACEELEISSNFGFDAEECKRLGSEINCNNEIAFTNKMNSIPMTKKGGVYEISATVNGVLKLNFTYDAGASDVSISPDVALTLVKTGTLTDENFIGTQNYILADGSIIKSKVFLIKEIQLGNKKIKNIKASISNSIDSPLLLGQSVLNKFGKVTIDYRKGIIVFED